MPAKKETQGAASFNLGAFLTKYSMVIALIVVFILFYFLSFVFLGLHLQHMEVPRLGV